MKNRYNGIDKFVITVIEREIAKLKNRYGIGEDDLDDLRQDLHRQVWKKITGRFSPDHPQFKAAVRRTVDARIKDVIKYRNAERRKGERYALRLDAPVETPDGDEAAYADLHDTELCCEWFGDAAPAWHRHRHEKMDLQSALERLPADLRRVVEAIDTLNGNLAAVERALGITRKKLRYHLEKLRWLLREEELGI